MDQKSHIKVIEEGFIILRADDQPTTRIKYIAKGQHNWITLEKFETKAARDRKLKELLQSSIYLID